MSPESSVYFLGAGASVEAGIPKTSQLLRKIRKQLTGSRRHGTLRNFLDTFDFEESSETGRPPVVEVISFLDSCIRESRPLDRRFTLDSLRRVRRQMVLELCDAIGVARVTERGSRKLTIPKEALDQPNARGRRIATYHHRFVRSLRPRPRLQDQPLRPGDSVITTNYDTEIDAGLFELAYIESPVWDVFLGSDFRDPYDDSDAFEDRESVVDLFKLHGSLNWLHCPRCYRLYIGAFGNSAKLLTGRRRDEIKCFCDHEPLEPVIIAPSAIQEITNPHLQSIWMKAYHVLENASRWVFIGYSLPPEDHAVRSLLYRALQGRREIFGEEPKIDVICDHRSSRLLRSRYKKMLGLKVHVFDKGFRAWVNSRWSANVPVKVEEHMWKELDIARRKSELRSWSEDEGLKRPS